MKPTPFNAASDFAPIPFDPDVLEAARSLKAAGLTWRPHVGCFVWDPDGHMPVSSPFPQRVYFVLNLGRFTELLGSVEELRDKLVWVPTYSQALALLAQRAGADSAYSPPADRPGAASVSSAVAAYLQIYDRLMKTLTS